MQKHENILIVEDLSSDAELAKWELKKSFKDVSFHVVCKEKEFSQALTDFGPDLIVSDYQMPAFNGLEALKIARQKAPFIPFIILTGSMNEDTAVVCMKNGADDYVIKEHIKRLGPAAINAIEKKKMEQERHQAMEALRESEAKLSVLYNSSPDMYVSVSPRDARILQCNDTLLKTMGYRRDEVVGSPVFKMYHQDCMEEVKKTFQQFIATGIVIDKELILQTKKGDRIDVSLNVKSIRDESGNILYSISSWRDISERKQAEQALEKSETKFKTLVETIPDLIWLKDPDGIYLACNKGFENFYGAAQREIIGKSDYDFVSKELADFFRENDQLAVNAGGPTVNEEEVTFAVDGHKEILETTKTPLFNSDGALIGVLGIGHDITERVQAEKALRTSEARFSAIFQSSPVAIALNRIGDNQIIDVNDAWLKLLGFTREEVIGNYNAALNLTVDHEGEAQLVKRLQKHDKISGFDIKMRKKSGELVDLLFFAQVINIENEPHVLSLALDVTERKRAQAEIKKFKTIADNAMHGSAIADLQGTLVYVNDYMAHVHGFEPQEVIGKNLTVFHNNAQLKDVEGINKLLATKGSYPPMEVRHCKKDGTTFPMMMSGVIIKDEGGADQYIATTALDISDLKNAQEDLRKNEERYRILADNSIDVLWQMDLRMNFTYVNPAIKTMIGYTPEEWIGTNLAQHATRQEFFKMARHVVSSIKNYKTFKYVNIQANLLKKDRQEIPVEIIGRLLLNEKGLPIGLQGSTRDITERKQAEAIVKESEEKYRNVVERASDGICIIQDDVVKYLNSHLAKLFGAPVEKIVDTPFQKYITPDDAERIYTLFQRRISGEDVPPTYETILHRANGESVYVEINAGIITYNKKPADLVIIRDVTYRRQTEERLRKLNSAVEQSSSSIMITDTDGVIEYVNPYFCRLTGYSKDEVLGQNPRILKSGENDPQLYTDLWNNITTGIEWRGELINRKKNGDHYWASASISPIKNSKNQITHFLSIKQDITEQKELEQQLRQSQKMEAVGKLAGGVAHDFNNLLTVINGYTELLLAPLHQDDSNYKKLLQIKKAGKRASGLTNQLLAFSRKQVLKAETLNINTLVGDTEKMLKRLIGEDIFLSTVCDPSVPFIKADAGQIDQIIMNMAINSRDAMPNGGTLLIETKSVYLDDAFVRQNKEVEKGPYVLLQVSDTGVGMDQKILSQIFEPFFTTKEKGKGTGLGLSTVYGIVKQSGGHIFVQSKPGEGTTFSIYFPAIANQQQHAQDEILDAHLYNGGETILLVEDEEGVRDLAEQSLKSLGYYVLTAIDGVDGLDRARKSNRHIDLLLADVIMPKMSGKEMADQINRISPQTKICFMSGYTDGAVLEQGIKHNDVHLLQKPFSLAELAKQVRAVLDES